jgi:hypothetical protein
MRLHLHIPPLEKLSHSLCCNRTQSKEDQIQSQSIAVEHVQSSLHYPSKLSNWKDVIKWNCGNPST